METQISKIVHLGTRYPHFLSQETAKDIPQLKFPFFAQRYVEIAYLSTQPIYTVPIAENGVQGRLKAFDARSGELTWTFYTVPNPGEVGHDTWPADSEVYKYGGATVWQTPAVDPPR